MKITRNLLADMYLSRSVVLYGPFCGTYLRSYSVGSGQPKWLGTYERELHAAWRRILASSPRLIFDIGGAEGYYACGLLRALPQARLEVWEMLDRERLLLRHNLVRNRVADRCAIHGFCDAAALSSAIAHTQPDLVVCDIEGGERDILTARTLASLSSATLVIETHGVEVFDGLVKLISETHSVEVIHPVPRTQDEWPLPWYLYATDTLKYWGIQERRTIPTPWIVAWPRGRLTACGTQP